MVLGERSTPPSFRQRIVGSEAQDIVTSGGKQVVRSGATGVTADLDITDWDLDPDNEAGGDLDLAGSKGLDGAVDVGGTDVVAIGITSENDVQFNVEMEWFSDSGTRVFYVDHNVDSDLQSSTGTGYNHRVAWVTEQFGDRYNVTVTSTAGAGTQNIINGSINAH